MSNPLVVIFDGDCSLCQKAKDQMEQIDYTGHLQFTPLQDPAIQAQFPQLKRVDLIRTMHAVSPTGEIYTGAKAYQEIGKRISPRSALGAAFKLYAIVTRIPGTLWIAELVYQAVANNRSRLAFGKPATCGLDLHAAPSEPESPNTPNR